MLSNSISGSTSTLTLTYHQNPSATGVTLQAQTSTDLQTWTNVSSTNEGTDPNSGDTHSGRPGAIRGRKAVPAHHGIGLSRASNCADGLGIKLAA